MLSNASPVSRPSIEPSSRRVQCGRPFSALAGAVALLALIAVVPSVAAAEPAPTSCTKVASPQGSDSAAGTAIAPLRTAQALVEALTPGQVGCLRAGSYGGGLRFTDGGTAGAPLTLRSYPGEKAQIAGRVYVPRGSDYVTVADLELDGSPQTGTPLPSPSINANHTTFEADDVTDDHTEICFDIGSEQWGEADSTVITGNRIHDCGLLPSRNQDHGIYVQDATNTQITDNLIDHNVDRGIQLYPSAQGTTVTGNVIAENGEGLSFSGADGDASSDSTVENNLIVNSTIRADVESWYPAGNPVGVNNVVQDNCISSRGINGYSRGFVAENNVTASASELVASEGGYAPAAGSACASVLPAATRAIAAQGIRSAAAPNSAELGIEAPKAGPRAPVGTSHEAPVGGNASTTPGHNASAAGKPMTSKRAGHHGRKSPRRKTHRHRSVKHAAPSHSAGHRGRG